MMTPDDFILDEYQQMLRSMSKMTILNPHSTHKVTWIEDSYSRSASRRSPSEKDFIEDWVSAFKKRGERDREVERQEVARAQILAQEARERALEKQKKEERLECERVEQERAELEQLPNYGMF